MNSSTTLLPRRTEKGALGGLLFCGVLLAILTMGACALDFAHVLAVRSELQNAADAAALGGAKAFARGEDDQAEANALSVAQTNHADGRAVSNDSSETNVDVLVTPAAVAGEPNIVRVDARMTIHHMLAPIFGRPTDTIAVRARAGAYGFVQTLAPGQAFPVAVNPRAWPNGVGGTEKPINQLQANQPVTLVIRPNGNPSRNAVWTPYHEATANTNYYNNLLQQYLGMIPPDPNSGIPSLEAGVDNINLDNGLNQGVSLDGSVYAPAIYDKPFVIFPLVATDNYNQQTQVIGFITVKVESITHTSGDMTIKGKLTRNIVKGWAGQLPASAPPEIVNYSPWVVKLLSNYES